MLWGLFFFIESKKIIIMRVKRKREMRERKSRKEMKDEHTQKKGKTPHFYLTNIYNNRKKKNKEEEEETFLSAALSLFLLSKRDGRQTKCVFSSATSRIILQRRFGGGVLFLMRLY